MSTHEAIDLPLTLGRQMAEARRRLSINQTELADTVGVHRNTVSRWERDVEVPGFDFVVWLSSVSGWPLHLFASAMKVTLPWQDPNAPEGLASGNSACNGADILAFRARALVPSRRAA